MTSVASVAVRRSRSGVAWRGVTAATRIAATAILCAAAGCGSPMAPSTSLRVLSISPAQGTVSGGTPVVITGTGFVAGVQVLIGGAAATNVSVTSSAQITATTAAHAAGPASVVVRLNGTDSTLAAAYSYVSAPPNAAPVIVSIAARGTRDREPDNFADVGETIVVTATVRDDDTPEGELAFTWSAASGVFSGTGSRVTWTAPTTAGVVDLRVSVRDTRGNPGDQPVTDGVNVAVHDSVAEIAAMSRRFLVAFSEQRLSPAEIVSDFRDGCGANGRGKRDEQQQTADNQLNYQITRWSVGTPRVTVRFGASCSFRSRSADACSLVDVLWVSTRLTEPTSPGDPPKGSSGQADGVDQVTAEYSGGRWWLCDSDFDGRSSFTSLRGVTGSFTFVK